MYFPLMTLNLSSARDLASKGTLRVTSSYNRQPKDQTSEEKEYGLLFHTSGGM